MKFLVQATMPNTAGNALCADKEMNAKMEALISEVKPESVYFGVNKGQRTIFCVVNIEGAHEIPRVAEPFWLGLKADVDFTPVMGPEEFKKANKFIENAVSKFNWK